MDIQFEGKTLKLDVEEIELPQAVVIYRKSNMTVLDLLEGMERLHPEALKALYWLAHEQSGIQVSYDHVNFKPLRFMEAIKAAAEVEAESAAESDSPKDE